MSNLTYSPRVVGTQRADFYSLETLLASPQLAGKKGEELALAVYDYFTSTVDGTYHFWSPDETRGIPRRRQRVDDAVKLINAYGWMLCGQHAAMQFQIHRAAGMPARQYGMPGHNLCEVYYDGRWHALDIDMWTWFRTKEGHIASATELQENARPLIVENKNKSNPCNLPDRTLEGYAEMYDEAKKTGFFEKAIQPPWSTRGHTMDFHLRPGETLVRGQGNRGCFIMPQEWKRSMQKFSSEWRAQPRERYEPFRTFGNGQWIYEPNLSSAFRDVELGAWEKSGVTQTRDGISGPGSITFRIQSPYPFCGKPDWSGDPIKYTDGVWLSIVGDGDVKVELDDAEGRWTTLTAAALHSFPYIVYSSTTKRDAVPVAKANPFEKRSDISDLLASRYDCLIRFTLEKGATLTNFKFDGTILTAPASLPRLIEGQNPMELRCGDQRGQCSVPWSHIIDFRGSADLRAQFERIENGTVKPFASTWQQLEATGGKPLQVVWRVDAPAGRMFASGYAEANINERPVGSAEQTAQLECSLDNKTWQRLSEIQLTATQVQWDCSLDGECVPPKPVRTLWFRITTPTGINRIEFRGQLHETPNEKQQLRIIHRWQEDGGEKTFEAPAGAVKYAIACGKNPRLHSIEMHSPSCSTSC
jgi:hypothetical protein